jgi:hypothetical protein
MSALIRTEREGSITLVIHFRGLQGKRHPNLFHELDTYRKTEKVQAWLFAGFEILDQSGAHSPPLGNRSVSAQVSGTQQNQCTVRLHPALPMFCQLLLGNVLYVDAVYPPAAIAGHTNDHEF